MRVALALAIALLALPANAATRYVAPNGAGSACTQSAPCGTLDAGEAAASSGDTVLAARGSYALAPFSTSKSGITYKCEERWACKIQPANGVDKGATLWTNSGQNVIIDGFELDGRTPNGGSAVRVGIYSTPGGSGPVVFQNNHVHHVYWYPCVGGGAGLLSDAYSAASAVTHFYNNWVHHTGQGNCNQVHNIYMSSAGDVVGNLSHNSSGWNIQSWHDAGPNQIWFNTVFRGASGNISVGNGDTYHGPKAWTGSIVNNISYDSPYGINVYGDIAAGQRIDTNIVNKNATQLNLRGQICTNCIDKDPQFVNYNADGTGDYHLKSGSPGIDAGTLTGKPAGMPATDMDGHARESSPDIGVFEMSGGVLPPDPQPGAPGTAVIIKSTTCDGLPQGALYNAGGTAKVCP